MEWMTPATCLPNDIPVLTQCFHKLILDIFKISHFLPADEILSTLILQTTAASSLIAGRRAATIAMTISGDNELAFALEQVSCPTLTSLIHPQSNKNFLSSPVPYSSPVIGQ
jgi:hypothetical protein